MVTEIEHKSDDTLTVRDTQESGGDKIPTKVISGFAEINSGRQRRDMCGADSVPTKRKVKLNP